MKKFLALFVWFPITLLTLVFSTLYLNYYQKTSQVKNDPKIYISQMPHNFYASIPKVLGAKIITTYKISSEDIVPDLVYNYLKKFHSPMLESSPNLIDTARKYEIDPLFMLSIAQCESNLGKKMPHKTEDKYECHNPFGWGIHQGGTLCFESWEEGYEAVAKGLKEKYYDKGYLTTEDIMVKYTPPALEKEGSWAKCVNYFLRKIEQEKQNYQ